MVDLVEYIIFPCFTSVPITKIYFSIFAAKNTFGGVTCGKWIEIREYLCEIVEKIGKFNWLQLESGAYQFMKKQRSEISCNSPFNVTIRFSNLFCINAKNKKL